jgi:GMP synthase (glutamine-hydrolysing)
VHEMFDAEEFIAESIESLQSTIDDIAIIACSGGVDSTVAAVIANKAVGNLLHCVYVDTGFMRKNETEQIETLLEAQGINLITVKAADRFFEALKGVTEPEQKRKIIGELFIRIFEDEQAKCGAKYLLQGTIAPDWIESGGGVRDTIKSHHNVGGLPADMTLTVVEPLRELYKDEVRDLARHLRINVAERQPFPGPGLAVRTLGELTPERVGVVREACAIVEEEFEAAAERGEMVLPWQYFAALLPVRSVGVHGDVRAYGETVVVRAVQSMDGMSARYSEIPHSVLQKISTRITNTVKGAVNRVVYDITHKPPGTIEWE